MGASGAGKTSLMNALADRINLKFGDSLSGTVNINDKAVLDSQLFGLVGTYVMQDDCLFGYFTVKEAITFSARLRLGVSREEQDKRV